MSDGVTPLTGPSSVPAALSAQLKGVNKPVISPRLAPGRPGMGTLLFDGGSDVVVKFVRRR